MNKKLAIFLIMAVLSTSYLGFAKPGGETSTYTAIILYPGAPNPADGKCLIRTYLPENDPFSSLRILNADSTLLTEISLAKETGISSTPINTSTWKDGKYLYQLFYKGETRFTNTLTVKH